MISYESSRMQTLIGPVPRLGCLFNTLNDAVIPYLRFSGVVREGCVMIGGRVMTQA